MGNALYVAFNRSMTDWDCGQSPCCFSYCKYLNKIKKFYIYYLNKK